jgi:hypothetical protein
MEDASAELLLLSEVRWLYKGRVSKNAHDLHEEVEFF